MSDNPTNPIMQLGGKVFGPVAKLLGLEAKVERLIDTVVRLREDQITLQNLARDINTQSISNRDMAVDFRQRSEDMRIRTDADINKLKQENVELRKEATQLRALMVELNHKIELDAKEREIELLKFKSDVQQAMQK